MRLLLVFTLLLAFVALPAVAQPLVPLEVLTDAAGDASVGEAVPSDAFPGADLRGLQYGADEGRVWLTLAVTSFSEASRPAADSVEYHVAFGFGGVLYRVRFERLVPVPVFSTEPVFAAQLYQMDPNTNVPRLVKDLNYTATENSVTAELPLFDVRGATGLPAGDGALFEHIVVTSVDSVGQVLRESATQLATLVGVPPQDLPATVYDRMPDTGEGRLELDIPVAVGQEVFFESPDPVRASNGGLGTYVFPLRLSNMDDEPHDRVLRVDGLPDGWRHAFVASSLRLQPGDDVLTQLVVEVTGVHAHGGATNFTVVASDLDGNDAGSVPLSVVYTDIAQPAGHHPTLYFHVLAGSGGLIPFNDAEAVAANLHRNPVIMNTLEEDPLESGEPATESSEEGGRQWRISLSPRLGMGVDFDLQRTGLLSITAASSSTTLPLPRFSVSGQLVLHRDAGDVVLANIEASEPVELLGPTEIQTQVVPTPEADLIPYSPGQDLELVLTADYSLDAAQQILGYTRANLLDGQISLPLLEYQDVVPLGTDRDIVAVVSPDRQYGNPGDVVQFRVQVTNAAAHALDLDVESLTSAVEASADAARIRVGVGDTTDFNVFVGVPANATEGDQFTAFFRLADKQVSTLVGATVIVSTTEEIDSAMGPGRGKDAAGLPMASLLVVLAFVMLRRR